jgi:alpha-L-rhamnosidase
MNKINHRLSLAFVLFAVLFGAALLFGGPAENPGGAVQGLRCEYLSNPLGIDVPKPRLSWLLNPAANVRGQSAYRVLVASSAAILQKDQGDLWDSGRVASAQTTWVEYAGKPLKSGQQAYWKVRVWTDAGQVLPWSAQANTLDVRIDSAKPHPPPHSESSQQGHSVPIR